MPIRLLKGWPLILRMHDSMHLLRQTEGVHGDGVAVSVKRSSGNPLPLPIVYDNESIRDYGAVVPVGVALTLTIGSRKLVLTDHAGAAVGPNGIQIQATPPPARVGAPRSGFFPPPDATVVHLFARTVGVP